MQSQKLTLAQLDWTDDHVPRSEKFEDFYFSTDGGLAEVEYVFIKHNFLQTRFAQIGAGQSFRIAETGFGSGLNFLSIAKLWLESTPPDSLLHFISFEKYPLSLADLSLAHQSFSSLQQVAGALREHYPYLLPGWHDVWLFAGRIRLTLWFGDVLKGLPECDASQGAKVDAWLLDGFSPAKNPDMWQTPLFQQMARLSHLQTTFATFTSAGEVRRALQACGFTVKKAQGYGVKREMCYGQLNQLRPYSLKAPWFSRPTPVKGPCKTAIVVGAGLAGASVAYQLANAGWQVTVLEAAEQVATQASGNLAGTVHPLITADWNLRSQWYLQGFEATLRALKPWLAERSVEGELNGMLQLAVTETSLNRVLDALKRVGLPENFAIWQTAQEMSARLNLAATPVSTTASTTKNESLDVQVASPGLYFPQGGWLNPVSIVKRCLQHPNITLHTAQPVTDMHLLTTPEESDATTWQVQTQQQIFSATVLVVATGSLASGLNQQLGLPIRPVKGQVTHVTRAQQNFELGVPLTHEGYSSPCGIDGVAVTGATFEAPDMSEQLSIEGHATNLNSAQHALPNWLRVNPPVDLQDNLPENSLGGRIAFRPTTPDHLPIFGAVPNAEWLQQAYLSQSHTHAVYRYPQQQYQPGLFVSNGHGPRGLMSVFLAAESILADIQGSALVQPLSLYHASHPARFKIRAWRSGQLGNVKI